MWSWQTQLTLWLGRLRICVFVLFLARQPPVGQGLLIFEISITHNDAPHSVGLLWTSDRLLAEISTWQHTTLTTDIHAPGGIRTQNLSRRAAADLHLRPRDHLDRQEYVYLKKKINPKIGRSFIICEILFSVAYHFSLWRHPRTFKKISCLKESPNPYWHIYKKVLK